jgi:predicted nucleic acid-binding protein
VRIAIDTNILVYSEGLNGAEKRTAVMSLLVGMPKGSGVIPVQVLGEFFNVLTRKAGRSREDARAAMLLWRDAFNVVETDLEVMVAASDLAADHHFSIWDAVIFAAASKSDCRFLLSEDMQDGFTWGGTTIINPFGPSVQTMLKSL